MMANQSRPFTAKPRIERTSQMISSVIISPIPKAYATRVAVVAQRRSGHRTQALNAARPMGQV